MARFSDKEAGLVKPPPALFKLVTEIAQGVLADHVLTKVFSSIVSEEEIEDLEGMAKEISEYLEDFENEDMEELFELLEDLFHDYRDVLRIVIADTKKDTYKNKNIRDDANLALTLFEKLLSWNVLDTIPYSDKSLKVLRDNKIDVMKLSFCLLYVSKNLKEKKESDPYQDKDMFELAQSRFPREYLKTDHTHINLGVKARINHPDFAHPLVLSFKFRDSNVLGTHSFRNSAHHINIMLPEKTDYSRYDLAQVKDTVRHELVHAVQSEIGQREGLSDSGGLPFKRRDTKITQHNKSKERQVRQELKDLGLDPNLANFHALDDVEFYTRLLDEVEEFRSRYFRNPLLRKNNTTVLRHINRSPFFRALKHFKRKSWNKAVGLFYQAVTEDSNTRVARQLIQDLAGVQTWVSKSRQDGLDNDTSAPEPSRQDYEDGKPQRDRVLPLPSGHPKGRDEYRAGPPVSNTPSDSSGASLNYGKAPNPNALPNQPDGKPLHQRPRSSGIPGDEYGHPYLDANKTTGLARRPKMAEEERTADPKYRGRAKITLRPPRRKQRDTKGTLKRKNRIDYIKKKRRDRGQMKRDNKRYYLRNKTKILLSGKRRRDNPKRYKRLEGGGSSTVTQKNQRSRKVQMRKKAMHREAVRSVLSRMYRQVPVESIRHINFAEKGAENMPTDPKLWGEIIDLAKGNRKNPVSRGDKTINPVRGGEGFRKYPSAYANGWASKSYKDLGGGWRKKASEKDMALTTLQVLLAILRGAHWAHWTSHWQVKGESQYGDHLLLERIYGSLIEEIDTLAEKIVGTYGGLAVSPVDQAQLMANTILPVAEVQAEDNPILRALIVEEALQVAFKNIYKALKEMDVLTLGMDDFIMSMANAHETNLYLLRQRCESPR